MDTNRVRAYAGGDSVVSKEKGGKFSLFSGSVTGENIEVVRFLFFFSFFPQTQLVFCVLVFDLGATAERSLEDCSKMAFFVLASRFVLHCHHQNFGKERQNDSGVDTRRGSRG
jgi:hypothetical protein